MSKLLFKMRHVPEDEAQEVRELLASNKIEFFETFAGNWGVSMPALWLKKRGSISAHGDSSMTISNKDL